MLAALPSVISLNLHHVPLELDRGFPALAELTALRTLGVRAGSRSLAIPPTIAKLQQVRHLTIDAHVLTGAEEIGALTKLETLALRRLRKVPDAILRCRALTRLTLDGPFRALPADIGSLENLRTLHVPHVGKFKAPASFASLRLHEFKGPPALAKQIQHAALPPDEDELEVQSIEEAQLEHGELASQLARLTRAPKLRRLRISGDHASLPEAIGELARLERLAIHLPELAVLCPAIGKLTKLVWLHLSCGKLHALPPELGDLVSLERLGIDNPALVLPTSIGRLPKLTQLSARMTTLPQELAECASLIAVDWNPPGAPHRHHSPCSASFRRCVRCS
ncbi:MAG: hypothetical protein KIT31_18645 [Deltaproteobacteria bacterium]|nr:hypothetical protein [Deltaproteobacteria bacterium]